MKPRAIVVVAGLFLAVFSFTTSCWVDEETAVTKIFGREDINEEDDWRGRVKAGSWGTQPRKRLEFRGGFRSGDYGGSRDIPVPEELKQEDSPQEPDDVIDYDRSTPTRRVTGHVKPLKPRVIVPDVAHPRVPTPKVTPPKH